MKTYRVVKTFIEESQNLSMDLVNINDETDRIMCAENQFLEGEIVNEYDFYLEYDNYVYDDGVGTAPFAYKGIDIFQESNKKKINICQKMK